MTVHEVRLRDFRCYGDAHVAFGDGLTVISGPNGAGKTNVLEGLYFGCTGRSCRTTNDRELVRFGAPGARTEIVCSDDAGMHRLTVGFIPGEPKRMTVDEAAVERLLDSPHRPLVSVFLPDRLELIKGAPAVRRAHLDRFIAALWPARAATRRAYAQTLAQRNALLSRIRAGHASPESLSGWDVQLALHGFALMEDRERSARALSEPFAQIGQRLGVGDALRVSYRPRSRAGDPQALADELSARVKSDLERGFTGHGPHRDELSILREERELRVYGSQGQQRVALLALLLAEREVIAATRSASPLMLLDDVMSELDGARRHALVALLQERAAQALITTTDIDQVPDLDDLDASHVRVAAGEIVQEALVG